jgi:hypothetical protein
MWCLLKYITSNNYFSSKQKLALEYHNFFVVGIFRLYILPLRSKLWIECCNLSLLPGIKIWLFANMKYFNVLFWNSYDTTVSSHIRSWCQLIFVLFCFTICQYISSLTSLFSCTSPLNSASKLIAILRLLNNIIFQHPVALL